MWFWLLLLLCGLGLIVLVFLGCACTIVPAKRVMVLRHGVTQQTRTIHEGLQWVAPWELPVPLWLPTGKHAQKYEDFAADPAMYYRYDPPPYAVLTSDQVAADVDLWVHYTVDLAKAVSYPTDFQAQLDDEVRAVTLRLVSKMPRSELNATALAACLAEVPWRTNGNGLCVTFVGVQHIAFDERMQAILRAQSAGLTAEQAVAHVQSMNLTDAMAGNAPGQAHWLVNAHVPVPTAAVQRQRRATRRNPGD